jgi:uncharacterized membrane protein
MSNVPIFPKEEANFSDKGYSEKQEEKSHFKRPEFIIIDDRQGKIHYTHFGTDSSQKSNDSIRTEQEELASSKKAPVSLRFLCFLGFIFCLLFGLGILIWSIALTFLAALSLFRNHHLNQGVRSFWKLYTHTVIAGLGFVFGIISPTLGLGWILLYFSLTGEVIDHHLLRKIIQRSFKNF